MNDSCKNRQDIIAIILAGGRNFGLSSLQTKLPVSLWPVGEEPILPRILIHLTRQGITKAVVCSNGDALLLQKLHNLKVPNNLALKFLDEPLPLGTAGCIRKSAKNSDSQLFIVLASSMVSPPDVDYLLHAHREGKSHLTIFFNQGPDNQQQYDRAADIYVCDRTVLKYIPEDGYFDIKQGLIPAMVGAGEPVNADILANDAGNFSDWRGYLSAVSSRLQQKPDLGQELKLLKQNDNQTIWAGSNVTIEPSARIFGNVIILDGAKISEKAVVVGPGVIGRNCFIGKSSTIVNSIIWDNARIGDDCLVRRCVVYSGSLVPNNTIREEEAIVSKQAGFTKVYGSSVYKPIKNIMNRVQTGLKEFSNQIKQLIPDSIARYTSSVSIILAVACLLLVFIWSYWVTIEDLWRVWRRSDEYSSGLLVPFLAVYVLWTRRKKIAQSPVEPSFWGIPVFIFAQAVRLFGLFFMYGSLERLSIVLSIGALILLIFGWKFFKSVSTILLFLCLMLPWPNRIQAAIALPLQTLATNSAVFCLELIGYEVVQQGNIINIGQSSVAVAEACNGLRMITAFFVIGAWMILLVERKWWEKTIVLLSCLPIAFICNTIRLAVTAVAFTVISGEQWEGIFHDFGGYAMMPLALGVIVAELSLLSKLTTPPAKEDLVVVKKK
jgi:exosortase